MFRSVFHSNVVCVLLLALALVVVTGCAERRSTLEPSFTVRPIPAETNAVITQRNVIVTPTNAIVTQRAVVLPQTNVVITPLASAVGRITRVNQQVMIAVVTFPVGQVPVAGGRYSIFRAGQKVGELKMSEETADTLRVADITSGSAQEGDEVRAP